MGQMTITFEVFWKGEPGQVGFTVGAKFIKASHGVSTAARDIAYAREMFRQAIGPMDLSLWAVPETLELVADRAYDWWGKKGSTVMHSLRVVINRGRTGAEMKDWNKLRAQRVVKKRQWRGRTAPQGAASGEVGRIQDVRFFEVKR